MHTSSITTMVSRRRVKCGRSDLCPYPSLSRVDLRLGWSLIPSDADRLLPCE